MAVTADTYARQLAHLLPRGPLWNLEAGSWLSKLLLGIADELARVDARGEDLVAEWSPRTAAETLDEWERVLGLPEEGQTLATTTSGRQSAVVQKFIAQGGATPAYFVGLAASLGFVVTIQEPGVAVPGAVSLVAAGTASSNGTPGVPVGYAANDILVAVVANSPAAPSGWTRLAYGTNGFGLYWRRSTASESAPNFGAGYVCRMAAFRGAVAAGDPFEVVGTPAGSTGVWGASPASITTLSAGDLVLHATASHAYDPDYQGATVSYSLPPSNDPTPALAFGSTYGNESTDAYGVALFYGSKPAAGATGAPHSVVGLGVDPENGTTNSWGVLVAMKAATTTLDANTWRMAVDLNASSAAYTLVGQEARAGSARAGDRVQNRSVAELERVVNRLKPAHTVALFAYLT